MSKLSVSFAWRHASRAEAQEVLHEHESGFLSASRERLRHSFVRDSQDDGEAVLGDEVVVS